MSCYTTSVDHACCQLWRKPFYIGEAAWEWGLEWTLELTSKFVE